MEPIDFEGTNCIFAKDQPEYMTLPVCKIIGEEGEVISIWKPTKKERFQILFGFNIGLSLWTFNNNLQPQRIFVSSQKEKLKKPFFKRIQDWLYKSN